MQQYPGTSNGPGTWYFLSGIAIGNGVSDRLTQSSTSGGTTYYATEHISFLRIQFDGTCFHIWDRSGYYYDLGCTSDSRQYYADANKNKVTYRWDLDQVLAPYQTTSQIRTMHISYLQDITNGNTVRDAVMKQIQYGMAPLNGAFTSIAGTIDFKYHAPAPFTQSAWTTPYPQNYNCLNTPPINTTLRCDDTLSYPNSTPSPQVMSTFDLDSVSSYVGNDSSTSHLDTSYAFSYKDTTFSHCYNSATLANQYCAGEPSADQCDPHHLQEWDRQSTETDDV